MYNVIMNSIDSTQYTSSTPAYLPDNLSDSSEGLLPILPFISLLPHLPSFPHLTPPLPPVIDLPSLISTLLLLLHFPYFTLSFTSVHPLILPAPSPPPMHDPFTCLTPHALPSLPSLPSPPSLHTPFTSLTPLSLHFSHSTLPSLDGILYTNLNYVIYNCMWTTDLVI